MGRRPKPTAAWRSRIVGEGEEAPDQLLANPDNWRVHPKDTPRRCSRSPASVTDARSSNSASFALSVPAIAAIGQAVTTSTRSLWYPPTTIGRTADKSYIDDDA